MFRPRQTMLFLFRTMEVDLWLIGSLCLRGRIKFSNIIVMFRTIQVLFHRDVSGFAKAT